MNLLVLSNNPDRPSFRQRIGIYIEPLQKAGINCFVEKLPEGYMARWRLFKKAKEFDGVFLHKKCLNKFDARILRKYSRKIIYDFDDAVMYSPKNPQSDYTSHMRLFKRTAAMADVIIAGNSYLAEHAGRFNSKVHILPTGLDVKKYEIDVKKPDDGKIRLVWIGSKSTLKYLAGIKPVLEEIGSQFKQAVLRIICDDFLDFGNLPVEKCIWSQDSQVTDLKQCDIGLAPLPDNRFTRGKCGFKILQYFACGLPVIGDSVGVQADFAAQNRGLAVSDSSRWFEGISSLIQQSDLRKNMGAAARYWVMQYGETVLAQRLIEIMKRSLQ
ncbi:MAG: glycosyltransferase [Phycisphaerae bacterium]